MQLKLSKLMRTRHLSRKYPIMHLRTVQFTRVLATRVFRWRANGQNKLVFPIVNRLLQKISCTQTY